MNKTSNTLEISYAFSDKLYDMIDSTLSKHGDNKEIEGCLLIMLAQATAYVMKGMNKDEDVLVDTHNLLLQALMMEVDNED